MSSSEVAQRPDGSIVVVSDEAGECSGCHRAAAFLINRDGRTLLCSVCDAYEHPDAHLERERGFLERMGRVLEEPRQFRARASEEGPWFVPA